MVVTIFKHNEGIFKWINSAPILFWYQSLWTTFGPQKLSKIRVLKVIVFSSSHSSSQWIMKFLCKIWFGYRNTWFKFHFQRNDFLKIDEKFYSYQYKTIISWKLTHDFNLRELFFWEDKNSWLLKLRFLKTSEAHK